MENGLQKMFDTWTYGTKFGEPIMTICEVFALTICVFYSMKSNVGKVFFCYLLFDFLILLFDYYLMYFSPPEQKKSMVLIYITNSCISEVELGVYYYLFNQILQSVTIKYLMKASFVLFTAFFVMLILFDRRDSYRYISGIVGAVEFLLLLVPCFAYYFQLFSITTSEDLLKKPSFWIVTGIFFYSAISIPYYLIGNFLQVNKYHFTTQLTTFMFYIPFSFNLLFLTKAFLCKKPLTI